MTAAIDLESGFHAIDSGIPGTGFQDSLSVELGFRIAINSGIPDSLSYILDSKTQNSGFHKPKSSGFRIPLHGLDPWKYKQSSPVSVKEIEDITWPRGDTNFTFEC